MTDGAWNDHVDLLVLDQLKTNQALIAAFNANPSNAVAPYTLTTHERNAFVLRSGIDFVRLGVVDTVSELPECLGGGGGGGGGHRPRPSDFGPEIIDRLREALKGVIQRVPRPPIRWPIPRPGPEPPRGPFPGPGPDPPGPTPGPDPPKPDLPGRGG